MDSTAACSVACCAHGLGLRRPELAFELDDLVSGGLRLGAKASAFAFLIGGASPLAVDVIAQLADPLDEGSSHLG